MRNAYLDDLRDQNYKEAVATEWKEIRAMDAKTTQTTPVDEHNFIYLQPWCKDCKDACDDRQWCQDDAWGECEECGLKPVKYARVK